MSTSNPSSIHPRVIVRAFGNEPAALFAYGLFNNNKWVLVGKHRAKKSIGLSVEDVFDYEQRTLDRLTEAYSCRDQRALEEIYENLGSENKSSTGACNRY